MPALRGLARSAAALAAAFVTTVFSAAPAAAVVVVPDAPAGSERAVAAVHPALVRVTGTFWGWVHDREGGYANNGEPYTFVFTCSGFGVHPDGYIATAGHCVDANDWSVREALVQAAAEEVVAGRPDLPLDEVFRHGLAAWAVEGETPGAPIMSEIRVTGIAGTSPDGLLARVVDDRPSGQGDVGLLKVDTTGLPTVELATGPGPSVGTPVFVAGYSDSAGERIAPGATPTFEGGSVDEVVTDGGRPVHRTNVAPEVGTSGGPAVDDSGRVLGINSVRTSGAGLFSLVVPVSGFVELLGRNGVRAELGPRDLRYREALDAYRGGEYTDAIEAVDLLQQEGPTHPRIAQLRSEAEHSRELHGDASENRLTTIVFWGSAATGGLILSAVIVALLVARRRRPRPVVMAPPPHPPFPGPVPPPAWRPGPPAGAPVHPYGRRPPLVGRAPASFDGPTRKISTAPDGRDG
jgi:serine protease Do